MTGTAPGKAILFGEHAVVYGRPAIAIPVFSVMAHASVSAADEGGIRIEARDIDYSTRVDLDNRTDPLQFAVAAGLQALAVEHPGSLLIEIESDIPVASGMGSSAAVTVAILHGLAAYYAVELAPERVAELAFEVEKLQHGTPSGIDNTVVALGQPVHFIKGRAPTRIRIAEPFTLIVADTGVPSPTGELVEAVRTLWRSQREHTELVFDSIAELTDQSLTAIQSGAVSSLGPLMNRNQALLELLGVSGPELEQLIEAALRGGAMGAKLSGAGGGGSMIALIDSDRAAEVEAALEKAGAARVIRTVVGE